MFRQHTPIERHLIRGREVFVKRDDLFGRPPSPPLGKLRGARLLLQRLFDSGVRIVGCWDTRISALGQGIAACCGELPGMKVLVAYPAKKHVVVPHSIRIAEALGAEIVPVRAARIPISFALARRIVESRKGIMLPFGLECAEAVEAVSLEAATVPKAYTRGGTAVVCSGSGVTLTGLIRGLRGRPSLFLAVSSGRSPLNILRCVTRYNESTRGVQVEPASCPYSEAIQYDCPFPSNPHYDLKAWRFLDQNMNRLPDPLLFWNVGA